jgi:hypothetical protein
MRHALVWAGLYNLLFGAWVVIWPSSIFSWLGMDPPTYLFLWQCIGMIVGVYGIGYLAASRDPMRHWPIVLVGFLGKILGPIGFLQTAMAGDIPWSFGFVIIFNDLIWWIPFSIILLNTWRSRGRVVEA